MDAELNAVLVSREHNMFLQLQELHLLDQFTTCSNIHVHMEIVMSGDNACNIDNAFLPKLWSMKLPPSIRLMVVSTMLLVMEDTMFQLMKHHMSTQKKEK